VRQRYVCAQVHRFCAPVHDRGAGSLRRMRVSGTVIPLVSLSADLEIQFLLITAAG
jgi:hypothetical protein